MLITGDILLDDTTRNPWVHLDLVRMLRSDFTIGTLAAPIAPDAEFVANALQAAGFNALFLSPTTDFEAMQRTQELIESTGVTTFGFASDDQPEPIVHGDTAILGVSDCGLPGWGKLEDAAYIKSGLVAATKTVVFLHLTSSKRSPTADANLERLRRGFVVSVGGRNPGFPDGEFAPGVFHDARRTRPGRPGIVTDLVGSTRRVVAQSERPGAMTRFADSVAEKALLFSLKLSQRADLDSTLFRAPRA